MKAQKYLVCIVAVVLVLSAVSFAETESFEHQRTLLAGPSPALAQIELLAVSMRAKSADPNEQALFRAELEKAKEKLKEAGLEVISTKDIRYKADTPELKISVDLVKLEDSKQYVWRVKTSLTCMVSSFPTHSQHFRADVWRIESPLKTVSVKKMPAAVKKQFANQIDTFLSLWKVNKEQTTDKKKAIEYEYIAARKSRVFHKSTCSFGKRIKPDNLVGFGSRDAAMTAGKRPCKRCNP